ncbi:uncharacterized protein TNCV_3527301 [Trichonephila clavipes]|nr:uncharacterized protein TNCV_3527301 [Trichonephila clavipes]
MKDQLKQFCLLVWVRMRMKRMLIFSPFLADQRASSKMASSEEKAFCVPQFAKTESATTVQRAFRWTPQWTCEHS